MSTATKTPPIRIRRTQPSLVSTPASKPAPVAAPASKSAPVAAPAPKPAPVAAPAPKPAPVAAPAPKPASQAKPLQALAQLVASLEKPKGPATTPRKVKHRPLVRVENPRRLRRGSKEAKKLGGMMIASKAWGSPFRCREIDGRWWVTWVGDQMRLAEYKPADWQDVPCQDRQEAAQFCQVAFRDWLTSELSAKLLEHARAILRSYNLVCHCPAGYPCHGDILIDLCNTGKLNVSNTSISSNTNEEPTR